MAKLAGKTGSVYIGSNILGIDAWTLDYKANTEETTDFSVSGVEAHIPTTTGWSGTFEGKKDGAPQAIGTEIALELRESQTATQKWVGQAILTGVSASNSAKGLNLYKYTFQGTGALTTIPTT